MAFIPPLNDNIITSISDVLNFIKDEYKKANEGNVMKTIYLLRVSNTIKYGIKSNGMNCEKSFSVMTADDDLEEVYKLLKQEFESEFKLMTSHSFDGTYRLMPIINERLMVIIDSTNPYDQNWFCEEENNRNRN